MKTEPENIRTDAEYRHCRTEVNRMVVDDPEPGTPDGDRLLLLAKLVEDYEKERFRFRCPDSVELLRFRLKEQGSG